MMQQNMIERMDPALQRFIRAMRAADVRYREVAEPALSAKSNAITRAENHRKAGVPSDKDAEYCSAVETAEEEYKKAIHGVRVICGRIFNESIRKYFEAHDKAWAGYIMNGEDENDTAGL